MPVGNYKNELLMEVDRMREDRGKGLMADMTRCERDWGVQIEASCLIACDP